MKYLKCFFMLPFILSGYYGVCKCGSDAGVGLVEPAFAAAPLTGAPAEFAKPTGRSFPPGKFIIEIGSSGSGDVAAAIEARFVELYQERMDTAKQISEHSLVPASIISLDGTERCISGYVAMIEEVEPSECCEDVYRYYIYFITGSGSHYETPDNPLEIRGSSEDVTKTVKIRLDDATGDGCGWLGVDVRTSIPIAGIQMSYRLTLYRWSKIQGAFELERELQSDDGEEYH
jgi:hypothetical protein